MLYILALIGLYTVFDWIFNNAWKLGRKAKNEESIGWSTVLNDYYDNDYPDIPDIPGTGDTSVLIPEIVVDDKGKEIEEIKPKKKRTYKKKKKAIVGEEKKEEK